jgi:hypothetical protein
VCRRLRSDAFLARLLVSSLKLEFETRRVCTRGQVQWPRTCPACQLPREIRAPQSAKSKLFFAKPSSALELGGELLPLLWKSMIPRQSDAAAHLSSTQFLPSRDRLSVQPENNDVGMRFWGRHDQAYSRTTRQKEKQETPDQEV